MSNQQFEIIDFKPNRTNPRAIAKLAVRIGGRMVDMKVRRSAADNSPYLVPTLGSYELERAIIAEVMGRVAGYGNSEECG